ncbi:MAG: hypothetical protein RLZ57_1120 [Actinomycetota bacterium]|jgi:myo-inositol-1(or 4)-monophosphatase
MTSAKSAQLLELLDIATMIAKKAGELLLDRPTTLTTDTKTSDIDIVTHMDKLSEKLIVSEIQKARPEDGIVGEEGADHPSKSGYVWHIDPVDGTVNYFYNIPGWNVSIGIEDSDGPCVGVVYSPTTNSLWTGARGNGSFLNGKRCKVNDPVELDRALISTGFPYVLEDRKFQIKMLSTLLMQIRDLRRTGGAAIDICNVASGGNDGYYEQRLKSWDRTAAFVIASEAGAIVSYDPERDLTLAAGPSLYPKLKAVAHQVLDSL